MKSRVTQPYSVEEAVRAHTWNAKPDRRSAEDELYQVALKYKRYETVNRIDAGDIVSVAMQSGAKKFNRTVDLQVGGNLFDRLLEAELPGKQVGKEYRLAHPDGDMVYVVQNARRLNIPAVDADMVKELGIEGVETPEALRLHYLRESMKQELYNEVFGFVPELLQKWDFVIDEEDLSQMDEYEMERCRAIAVSKGMVFDEMTEEQLRSAVGCGNIQEFRAMTHEFHQKSLRTALAEAWLSGRTAAEMTPKDVYGLYAAFTDRIVRCALNQMKEE